MNRELAILAAVVLIGSVGFAHAFSCDNLPPEVCETYLEETNPYLRMTPEKVIEQARSVDTRMAAGNEPGIKEVMNTFVALQRIGKSAPQYAEAQRLLDSWLKRIERKAAQATAKIKDPAVLHRQHQQDAIDKISDCNDESIKIIIPNVCDVLWLRYGSNFDPKHL